MLRRARQSAVLGAAVLAGLTVAAGTAAAAPLHVRGTQTVIDENTGTSAMHGTLVGTWYTTSFVPTFESPSLFAATGTERFVGCVDRNHDRRCGQAELHGALGFSFVYWANFDPTSGAFRHGQCVHPVVRGTGSFRGATGILFMDDTVHGDRVVTTYHGQIAFGAGSTASQAAAPRRSGATAAPRPSRGRPAC